MKHNKNRAPWKKWGLRLLTCTTLIILAVTLYQLSKNPLAQPFVDRTEAELRLRLNKLIADEISQEWLDKQTLEALATVPADWHTLGLLDQLEADYSVKRSATVSKQIEATRTRDHSFIAKAKACSAGITQREFSGHTTSLVCGGINEFLPTGDIKSLLYAANDWRKNQPVDHIEVTLASLGLVSTVAIVASGGTSLSVKAGTGTLKTAKRLGTLPPALTADLARMGRSVVHWDKVPRKLIPLTQTLRSPTKRAKLFDPIIVKQGQELARDIGHMAKYAPKAHAPYLLAFVDNSADAKRVATVSKTMKVKALPSFKVLGKARVLKAIQKLSRAAKIMIGLLTALLAQVLAILFLFGKLLAVRVLKVTLR